MLFRRGCLFGDRKDSFASVPKNEITRIELSLKGEKVFLVNEGNGWMVNGKFEARKSGVIFILGILKEMKIKSPVSPELFNNEITLKGINPVRVRVYEKKRLLKSFLVFRTRSNKYGNIMKLKESTNPFIVHVPGYEGDIGSEFVANELFWMPYTVFNVRPSEISSVTLENIADPASSFTITNTGDKYRLSDPKTGLTGWDSSRVARYISYFTWVPFENWVFDISAEEKKRIESQNPIFRITVKKTDGSQINLTLWEKYDTDKKNSDRLWAKMEGKDELFVIRYFDVDPLLKKKIYFFPE